jgi:hypothetical protein
MIRPTLLTETSKFKSFLTPNDQNKKRKEKKKVKAYYNSLKALK